ncbi:MAG: cofactor assembly of complex C subunit B [Hormoscilla sp. GM7CHS1pb]|nr:cofactor assembly of complex C subunit B [Hormoscilla sp. GM7CHS1pb]
MSSALVSTALIPTLLLFVGWFFFIKASVKDRTEKITIAAASDQMLTQLEEYFTQRAYRVTARDSTNKRVIFEGFVRPSLFLAIFLTLLAAVGILCGSCILSIVFPQWNLVWFSLVFLSPVAGIFYWQKAGRVEQVSLAIETKPDAESQHNSSIAITAHRDELAQLQNVFPLSKLETPINSPAQP